MLFHLISCRHSASALVFHVHYKTAQTQVWFSKHGRPFQASAESVLTALLFSCPPKLSLQLSTKEVTTSRSRAVKRRIPPSRKLEGSAAINKRGPSRGQLRRSPRGAGRSGPSAPPTVAPCGRAKCRLTLKGGRGGSEGGQGGPLPRAERARFLKRRSR